MTWNDWYTKIYLKSDDWKKVKRECIKRDKNCADCGLPYQIGCHDVHHETYEHCGKANWEELESVVLVCRDCHQQRHGRKSMSRIERDLEKWLT